MPYAVIERERRTKDPSSLESYAGPEIAEFDIPPGPYASMSEANEVAKALAEYLDTDFVVASTTNGIVLWTTFWEPAVAPEKRETKTHSSPKLKKK